MSWRGDCETRIWPICVQSMPSFPGAKGLSIHYIVLRKSLGQLERHVLKFHMFQVHVDQIRIGHRRKGGLDPPNNVIAPLGTTCVGCDQTGSSA